MPKARVLKGGWTWKGVLQQAGDVIDAPSEQWIANRVADGGLVEAIEDAPAPVVQEIETRVVVPAETATVEHTTVPANAGLLGGRRRGNQRRG